MQLFSAYLIRHSTKSESVADVFLPYKMVVIQSKICYNKRMEKLIKIFRIINILNGMIYFLSCGFEPFGKNKELKSKVIFDE